MVWMKHTGCRYHTQDTGYYCSAACSMMVLAEMGVPYSQLDQDDLYNDIHANSASGWYGDCNGISLVLNQRKPQGHFGFSPYTPTTEAEGSRKIVETLKKYNTSPIALVYGCQHWIVVPGCSTDIEPVTNSNYSINGFWLNNPVFQYNEPHDGQDPCGNGPPNGSANEYVTYTQWQNLYFTGCNDQGTTKFITVVDPEPPKLNLPRFVARHILADGRKLILHKEAIEFTMTGIKKHLAEDKRVSEVLGTTQAADPLLVKRLDKLNDYYYLVPWENANGVKAYSEVDARYGEFLGIRLLEKVVKRPRMFRRMETRTLIDSLREQTKGRIELEKQNRALKLFPEALSVSSTMVWMPCQESFSPAMPFYLYTIGTTPIYVRIDGRIFTDLTTVFTTGVKGD